MSNLHKRQSPVGPGLRDYELISGRKYTPRTATVNAASAQTIANCITRIVPIEAAVPSATRFPPYGREVANAVAAGRVLNVTVFAGRDAWQRASTRRGKRGKASTMLLPPGEKPEAYRWPGVRNGVMVVAPDRADAFALSRAIASNGTPLVFAVFGDNESLIVRSDEWAELRATA